MYAADTTRRVRSLNTPGRKKCPSSAESLSQKDNNLLKRPVVMKGKKKVLGFDEAALKRLL
ncbi:MAG: hypothetical protein HYY46_08495 [Deltaproteobacteria bacterium]|nr:hypothetical protein [Deltaproteobacteria bacterium]